MPKYSTRVIILGKTKMNQTKELISAAEINALLPLTNIHKQDILKHRQEIKNILAGHDKRLILIIGPCSAWPNTAVLKYAKLLANLERQVANKIKIIMRVYPHKPRTTLGWQGALLQPELHQEVDINSGLKYSRKMMLDVIEIGLPIASEILNINLHNYFIDLLSWVAVGARSSENQEHRLFASYLDIATGLKNPTHGSLEVAINSIITAQHKHSIILGNYQIPTSGNPFAHLVLRGGNKKPNFSNANLEIVYNLFKQHKIVNPSIIIDVNHDNSIFNDKPNYTMQIQNIFAILDNINQNSNYKNLVKGFMVESFLQDGNQNIKNNEIDLDGLSITDPCIGWEKTEKLIMDLSVKL